MQAAVWAIVQEMESVSVLLKVVVAASAPAQEMETVFGLLQVMVLVVCVCSLVQVEVEVEEAAVVEVQCPWGPHPHTPLHRLQSLSAIQLEQVELALVPEAGLLFLKLAPLTPFQQVP